MTGKGKSPLKNPDKKFGPNPIGSPCKKCKKKKIRLVELIEVVTRKGKGLVGVEGAAPKPKDMKEVVQRTDKDDANTYKQYINLNKDLDGKDKRHFEYGRYIELRARVEWETGKKEKLNGRKVIWRFEMVQGQYRPALLKGGEKEGFSSPGGKQQHISSTYGQGWTEVVRFYLSQYAGDSFKITVQADEEGTGKYIGKVMETGFYTVWRRFWYQMTYWDGYVVNHPTDSAKEYKRLCAEMLVSDEVKYKKEDAPSRTFYPEWMVSDGVGFGDVLVIGTHADWFHKKFKKEKNKLVKAHLIICRAYWWPQGVKSYKTKINTNPSQELSIPLGDDTYGILKPSLKGKFIINGRWKSLAPTGQPGYGKKGSLTDDNILIDSSRTNFNCIKVQLPPGAPNPSTHPVEIKLTLSYSSRWGGESSGSRILIEYDSADLVTYNDVVIHEVGHSFNQTPAPEKQPKSLNKHPKWYVGHGGVGDHCFTDSTKVNTPGKKEKFVYENGTCNMFHQLNSNWKHKFCVTCEPYIRLQNMSKIK